MKELKLFVWTGFAPDYDNGLAFALATDETHARKLIIRRLKYTPEDWGTLEIRKTTTPYGHCVTGGM